MTITARDAAGAANYLATLKVLTLNGNEGTVWADYLNAVCPLVNSHDLHQAVRLAAGTWAELRRSYQIDVEHIHQALRKIHAERIKNAGIKPPRGLENAPEVEIRWLKIVREQVAAGTPLHTAESCAWQTIGRKPPPETPKIRCPEFKKQLAQIGEKP